MSIKNEAQNTSVVGWVRNNETTGEVNALLKGPATEVDQLLRWCRVGPTFADVQDVRVQPVPEQLRATIRTYFYIRESEW